MTETLNIRIALQGLNEVSKGINGIGDRMRSVVAGLSAIGAAVAGSAIVREFAAINGEIAKTASEAEKFGVSTEFLSSFQYALRATGVEQSKLAEAMKGYVEKAQSQGRAIGDLSGELMRQAEVFSRMPDGPQKTALAMNLFGEAGIALIPVLNKGEDGLRELTDEARRFGIVVDGDAAKAAKAMKLDMERLGAVFDGIKIKLVQDLTPAFSQLTKSALAFATLRNPAGGGESWLKQAADDVAAGVQNLGRRYLETKGFVDSFVASLWVTMSPTQAVNQAIADSNRLLDEYDGNLAKLNKPLTQVAEDAKVAAGAVNYLQRSMANANALLDIRTITARGDNSTDVAKRSEERAIAAQRMAELQRQQKALEASRPADMGAFMGPDGRITQTEEAIAYQERHIALMREQAVVQSELNALGASETSMVWTQTMLDIQNQWGSWSAQIAGALAGTFNTAIGTISSNLTAVIMQTRSWGQALASIGNTILTTVIQSIIEMGVRWVLTRAMVGIANIAWSQKEAVAAAPKAMMESISSYGVAALLGGAAFAGIMAAVGGFEAGGYTGNLGTSTPAGIVHGREFVMSAPATASIGVDALEAMNDTGVVPAGGGREQRIVIVDDARTASDLQNDPEFENVVISLMGRNAWRIRG